MCLYILHFLSLGEVHLIIKMHITWIKLLVLILNRENAELAILLKIWWLSWEVYLLWLINILRLLQLRREVGIYLRSRPDIKGLWCGPWNHGRDCFVNLFGLLSLLILRLLRNELELKSIFISTMDMRDAHILHLGDDL